jgi:hypothetical protein
MEGVNARREENSSSNIGGPSLSKSSQSGYFFCQNPTTPPKSNMLKGCFKISVHLLNIRLSDFYISVGSVLNETQN